jgi:GNAT superfamily N-acetyltransferase
LATVRPVVLRPASVADVGVLSALAIRSKAHWGYADAFMDARRDELSVHPADVDRHRLTVVVRETTHRIVGFYGLSGTSTDDAELSALFVEPEAMGNGLGRLPFEEAIRGAREEGFPRLRIEADRFAGDFYAHMGATLIGTTASHSIPDRALPLYVFDLTNTGRAGLP